jgi:hypothetical protein
VKNAAIDVNALKVVEKLTGAGCDALLLSAQSIAEKSESRTYCLIFILPNGSRSRTFRAALVPCEQSCS